MPNSDKTSIMSPPVQRCVRTLGKRSISPNQADQGAGEAQATDGWNQSSHPDGMGNKKLKTDELYSQSYAGVVDSRTSEGWLKTPCTSESSDLSPIHEEQSAEGPVPANEAENTWQNPVTNQGKKARKNNKKRKNEGSESTASLFDVPAVW